MQPTAVQTMYAPPPALVAGPDLGTLLGALRRRWVLAFTLGVVLATAAGYGAWTLLGAKATAFALVQVHQNVPTTTGMGRGIDTPESRSEFQTTINMAAAEVKSHSVLRRAFESPEVQAFGLASQYPDPIAWLEDELKVEYKENAEIIRVSLSGTRPEEVKALVKAVSEAYDRNVAQVEPLRRKTRLQQQQRVYATKTKSLSEKKQKLHDMAEALGTSDGGTLALKQQNLVKLWGEKQAALFQTSREFDRISARLEVHKAREAAFKKPTLQESDLTAVLDNDKIAQVHQVDLLRQKKTMANYAGRESETAYRLAQERVKVLEKALAERREELRPILTERLKQQAQGTYDVHLAQLEAEVKPLADDKERLKKEVEELQKEGDKVGKYSTEFEMLKSDIHVENDFVDRLQREIEILEVEQDSPPRAVLYQPAALEKRDMKRQIAAAAGAPIAVLLLVGVSVGYWEFRARRIQKSDEVAVGLGIRVVGAVPNLPDKTRRAAIAGGESDARGHLLLESIDAIRTLLLRADSVEPTRVVMVTSAVPGEGKTTLASHLASSLARAGRRTLLMDCDLRSPAAHQLFELPLQPGFSEVLLEEIDPTHAVQPTNIEGLSLMAAGQWDREVLQALARDGVGRLLSLLKEDFDFIIIDSHPILPATDSLLLGQSVDAVLLSVLRDVSQAPRVYAACQRLGTLGIRVLGAVVNGTDADDLYTPSGAYAVPVRQ